MSGTPVNPAIRQVDVHRRGAAGPVADRVAVELPLQVRLNGEPFSVIMRTPGADRELALGFLFSEGVVRAREDVERVVASDSDTVDVHLAGERRAVALQALGSRRQVTMNSSCGLCGRRELESLRVPLTPLRAGWRVSGNVIAGLPGALLEAQRAFAETGGLHAAGLFDPDGRLQASAEDVGRHNAVDKLLGRMLDAGALPLSQSLLVVSGRSSFEIVQKAWLGGIPLVAAVSAPSSLAVDLAREAGITLLGFVRDGRFNVYAHPERVALTGED
ncbi:MAG TPA: formate dehydrogenase accessory sulfurtransferase FdhD [Vicinamibacterales bacterium]